MCGAVSWHVRVSVCTSVRLCVCVRVCVCGSCPLHESFLCRLVVYWWTKDLVCSLDSAVGATKHALAHTSHLEIMVSRTACQKNPAVARASAQSLSHT